MTGVDQNQSQGRILIDKGILSADIVSRALRATVSGSGDLCETLIANSYLKRDLADRIRSLASSTQKYNVQKSRSQTKKQRRDRLIKELSQELHEDPLFQPLANLNFERLSLLGEGGMGTVYRVRDKSLGRQAALKLLRDKDAHSSLKARFHRETRITANLDHPSIPPVYQAGMTGNDELYMIMKVIEGQTLAQLIKNYHENDRPGSELRSLLGILVKVSEAMEYAHSKGILHRDIKPDNIMVGGHGEVMVMDWGIARDLSEKDDIEELKQDARALATSDLEGMGLTQAGAVLGTPGYMPPEQAGGEEVDARSDIFALGAVLTEVLTKELPVVGDSALNRVVQTCEGNIRGPRDIDHSINPELDAIVQNALSFDPADRFQKVSDWTQHLKLYLAGEDLPIYSYNGWETVQRWARRHPSTLLISLTVALIFVFGSVVGSQLWISRIQQNTLRVTAQLAKVQQRQAEDVAQKARKRARSERLKKEVAEAKQKTLQRIVTLLNEAEAQVSKQRDVFEIEKKIGEAISLSKGQENFALKAARIYQRGGFYRRAKGVLKGIVNSKANAYEALFQLHLLTLQDSNSDLLQKTPYMDQLVKEAKKAGDENEFTLYYGALEARLGKNSIKALELIHRAENMNQNMPWIYLTRATILHEMARDEEALKDCTRAINLNPGLSAAYDQRGNVYRDLRRAREALEDYNQAIKLNPYHYGSYHNRGVLYDNLGQLEKAFVDYSKCIKINDKYAPALYNRGLIYSKNKQLRKALADYTQAIRYKGDWAQAHYNRGLCHLYLKHPDQALDDFSRSIELDPKAVKSYLNRGVLYSEQNKLDLALKDYDNAILYGGDHAHVLSNRAALNFRMRKFKDALKDCNRALKADPNYTAALVNRGSIRAELGDKVGALEDLRNFVRREPGSPRLGAVKELIDALSRP
jgi:serine/threonine protein kinase/tetratricopeptide (TPR) repeat protein